MWKTSEPQNKTLGGAISFRSAAGGMMGKIGSRTCQWAPPFREEVQAGCDADDQYATAQEQAGGINSPSEKMIESFESKTKNGCG